MGLALAKEEDVWGNDLIIALSTNRATGELLPKCEDTWQQVLDQALLIKGTLGSALADWRTGICLYTAGNAAGFNLESASVMFAGVLRNHLDICAELKKNAAVETLQVTLKDQIHIIHPLPKVPGLFFYLVLDKQEANLALACYKLEELSTQVAY